MTRKFIFFLKYVYFNFFKRKLRVIHNLYTNTDESDKFKHLIESVNYIRVACIKGELMEFGCHSGRTFSIILNSLKYFKMSNRRLHAFDSFQGLPNSISVDEPYFKPGMFATSLSDFLSIVKSNTGNKIDTSLIHVGFYNDILPSLSATFDEEIAMLHIDVDLYASTVPILEFVSNKLADGAVILFDDYYCHSPNSNLGERRAFDEFITNNPNFFVTHWKNYSTFGASFIVSKKK